MGMFRQWGLAYSGCSGGDIGNPRHPATWVCGIEPGGAHSLGARALGETLRCGPLTRPPRGYDDWRTNLANSFTRRIVKLLAALHGEPVSGYRAFAQQRQPFTRGSRGFFRLNLYPIGFPDTSPARWNQDFKQITGFAHKTDYLSWCDQNRLPVMRSWARKRRPAAVVCLGKSYRDKFRIAFMDQRTTLQHETILGRELSWGRNSDGAVIAVLPFLTSASGLQSDAAIQAFGARLRDIVRDAWSLGRRKSYSEAGGKRAQFAPDFEDDS